MRKERYDNDTFTFPSLLQSVEKELDGNIPRLERISVQKKLNVLQKELKNREQNLFMDGLRLEKEAEAEIDELLDKTNYIVDIKRHFVVEVRGRYEQ